MKFLVCFVAILAVVSASDEPVPEKKVVKRGIYGGGYGIGYGGGYGFGYGGGYGGGYGIGYGGGYRVAAPVIAAPVIRTYAAPIIRPAVYHAPVIVRPAVSIGYGGGYGGYRYGGHSRGWW